MKKIFEWIQANIARVIEEHKQRNAAVADSGQAAEAESHGHGHGHGHGHDHDHGTGTTTSALKSLSHFATLDTLVTVVDAVNIFGVLSSIETLADENNSAQMLGNSGAVTKEDRRQLALLSAVEGLIQDYAKLIQDSPETGIEKIAATINERRDLLTVTAEQVREALSTIKERQIRASANGGDGAEPAIDDRPLSQLMLDQLEFADVIVVSKASLLLDQEENDDKENEGDQATEEQSDATQRAALMSRFARAAEALATSDLEDIVQLAEQRVPNGSGEQSHDENAQRAQAEQAARAARLERQLMGYYSGRGSEPTLAEHYSSAEPGPQPEPQAKPRQGNKAGEERLGMIKGLLQKLNPKARIVIPREDKYADMDVAKELLNTELFNMEAAQRSAGWLQELAKTEHVPETEEYGISSIVFREQEMPFHPERLHSILTGFGSYESAMAVADVAAARLSDKAGEKGEGGEEAAVPEVRPFEGVVRSKGNMWLANAHAFPIGFHAAGKQLTFGAAEMPFRAALIDAGVDKSHVKVKKGKWRERFGDRQSELVFIGVHLNKELIMERLTAALLTEEESEALGGVPGWKSLADPFFGGVCAEQYFSIEGRSSSHAKSFFDDHQVEMRRIRQLASEDRAKVTNPRFEDLFDGERNHVNHFYRYSRFAVPSVSLTPKVSLFLLGAHVDSATVGANGLEDHRGCPPALVGHHRPCHAL